MKLESVNQAFGHVKMLTIQGMAISTIVNTLKPSKITVAAGNSLMWKHPLNHPIPNRHLCDDG